MKKNVLIIISLLVSFSSFCQTAINHMTFKGIPIDGNLTEFTAKMKQKGLTHAGTQDGVAFFEGEFAAFKNCIIGAVGSQKTSVVNKVFVIFPDCKTWSDLYGNYSELKDLMIKKYGEPSECVERFDAYFEPNDDNDRMMEVKSDNCKYISVWETDKGDIELSISHIEYSECFVTLDYWDKINTEKVKDAAIDDL